jgi:lipopolysaccharide transport system ATP-binding protein
MSDVLVKVESVSKKFCRSLKKSLWYGMQDLGRELIGQRYGGNEELRPDEFWSVRDVSFELKRGECLGLIGPNGAGKSTILKMLNGLIKPDKGRIEMNGRIGALIELGAGFNPILTGRENIYVNGSVLGFTKKEIDQKLDAIIDFAGIEEFVDSPVQNYSSGMKVRLGFAVAAQMEPDVLIIDEVLAVGDISFTIKCLNRVHELLARSAVIFVSHSMPFVARLCTQVIVMQKGEKVFSSLIVPEGVDFYHKQLCDKGQRVMGSGEAKIFSLSINGEKGEAVPIIPFGGRLHLEMCLKILSKCERLGIRLAVWNIDQRHVIDVVGENYELFTWENDEKKVSLKVEIPALFLASGRYSVAIVVLDPEMTRILSRVDNAISFIMGQHLATGADSFHAATWSKCSGILCD